eukprot:7502289-Pyramimonas_sp.AAC.1
MFFSNLLGFVAGLLEEGGAHLLGPICQLLGPAIELFTIRRGNFILGVVNIEKANVDGEDILLPVKDVLD